MAKKGHNYKQKALSVSAVRHLSRKALTWTIKQYPGAHTGSRSVPIAFVLRDMLKMAHTMREARHILNAGNVSIDGTQVREAKHAVGLFDVVSVGGKHYRLAYDLKGRLVVMETDAKTATQKIGRVIRKNRVKGNKLQVQTHDGYTYKNADSKIQVGDSVIVTPLDGKIVQHLRMQKGNSVYIIGGTHVGEVAKVAAVIEGTMKRSKLVELTEGKEKFQTTEANVVVVDDGMLNWLKQTMHVTMNNTARANGGMQ